MNYKEKIITEDIYAGQNIEPVIEHVVEYSRSQTKNKQDEPEPSIRAIELIELEEDGLTAPYDGLEVSLETYWAEFYGQTEHTYEWNNGILEAKPMAKLIQVKAYLWFLSILKDYLFGNAIAEMTLLETPFQFNIPGKTKVRIPDLAVVLNDNPAPLGLYDRTYNGIFDICVESVSDSKRSEVERDTTVKRGEYAQGGVTEYYILDEKRPLNRKCETAFYQLNSSGVYQPIRPINGVIRSTILPGFQFRVDDLEDRPTPLEMLDDPVYRGYTSPLLRAERERAARELRAEQERAELELQAEQKRAKAEQERAARELQAEQERAKAERERAERAEAEREKLNAYLRDQGISLPNDY